MAQRQGDQGTGPKGKKRKRKDRGNAAEKTAPERDVQRPPKAASASQPTEVLSGFQRMDEETTTYLTEVKSHFDTLDDAEEMSLLVQAPCTMQAV